MKRRAYPRAEAPVLWCYERAKAEALAYLEARRGKKSKGEMRVRKVREVAVGLTSSGSFAALRMTARKTCAPPGSG